MRSTSSMAVLLFFERTAKNPCIGMLDKKGNEVTSFVRMPDVIVRRHKEWRFMTMFTNKKISAGIALAQAMGLSASEVIVGKGGVC